MFSGLLLSWADWGPGQPSGRYQPNRRDHPSRKDHPSRGQQPSGRYQPSRRDHPIREDQPGGGDQHCLYLVGGRLGHHWADLNCQEDMNFLCEMDVNQADPWLHVWPQVRRSTVLY